MVVVSYCWQTQQHPDPSGTLLKMLGAFLHWYAAQRANCAERWSIQDPDFAVFLDFWSLYQGPIPSICAVRCPVLRAVVLRPGDRSPEEEASFR